MLRRLIDQMAARTAEEINVAALCQALGARKETVKAASTVDVQDFRHIDWFRSEGPGHDYRSAGFVIYLGSQLLSFGPGRIAVPVSMLWSFKK